MPRRPGLPPGATATQLVTGYNFTEGPVYDGAGGVYFTNLIFSNQNSSDVSAEFIGPLHFMQFWLDTIGKWERDVAAGRVRAATKSLIALSATKDVQDAILADAKRSATVDVIDFRYWRRTDKGEFAPRGGKNRAPRQFERQWRGQQDHAPRIGRREDHRQRANDQHRDPPVARVETGRRYLDFLGGTSYFTTTDFSSPVITSSSGAQSRGT